MRNSSLCENSFQRGVLLERGDKTLNLGSLQSIIITFFFFFYFNLCDSPARLLKCWKTGLLFFSFALFCIYLQYKGSDLK